MKFAGIIAEYDPFHNGHALLLERAREAMGGAVRWCSGGRCPSCLKLSAPSPPSPAGLTLCLPCLLPVPARGQRRSPGRAWRCLPPLGATVWCSVPRRPTRLF